MESANIEKDYFNFHIYVNWLVSSDIYGYAVSNPKCVMLKQ